MSEYTLPDGATTTNEVQYICEWQSTAQRIERAVDVTVISSNPGFQITDKDGGVTSVPMWLVRKIIQLAEQRDEATAWRPIETVPIDGTVVMLYGDGRVTCGSWIAEQVIMVGEHHHTTGEWLGAYPSGETTPAYWESHDGGFTEEHPPTHWMPLPKPPREKEGGGA